VFVNSFFQGAWSRERVGRGKETHPCPGLGHVKNNSSLGTGATAETGSMRKKQGGGGGNHRGRGWIHERYKFDGLSFDKGTPKPNQEPNGEKKANEGRSGERHRSTARLRVKRRDVRGQEGNKSRGQGDVLTISGGAINNAHVNQEGKAARRERNSQKRTYGRADPVTEKKRVTESKTRRKILRGKQTKRGQTPREGMTVAPEEES